MMTATKHTDVGTVTTAMREQYESEGYFILDGILGRDQLNLLRNGAQYATNKMEQKLAALRRRPQANISADDKRFLEFFGKKRYFVPGYRNNPDYFDEDILSNRPDLRPFLFSDVMADICRATIGDQAYFFWEQYAIKGADPGTTFAWHQDSGYVHENHDPYLTCWIALDDITEANGPVYILPYSRSGIRSYVRHIEDPKTGEYVCYFGSDQGIPVTVPAGTIVCFSSVLLHRSSANLTSKLRRSYIAQYSPSIIMNKEGTEPHGLFEKFLENGSSVK